jgi:hypothetical protein
MVPRFRIVVERYDAATVKDHVARLQRSIGRECAVRSVV